MYQAHDDGDGLSTMTLGPRQWRMIRMMLEFHDGDEDVFDHLQCSPTEWVELLAKFDVRPVAEKAADFGVRVTP